MLYSFSTSGSKTDGKVPLLRCDGKKYCCLSLTFQLIEMGSAIQN